MTDLDKIQEMLDSDKVKYGLNLPDSLHKKLAMGQTRYVWRYGTLSDGHEKIIPAARYFQAIKEIYNLAQALADQRCSAMEARADELDGLEAKERAKTEQDHLRADAKIARARNRLQGALIGAQEAYRGLDECNKVRLELEPEVEAKYPEGIEQAQLDIWKSVAEFRLLREQTPGNGRENLNHIPLPPDVKAAMGLEHKRVDMLAPQLIEQKRLQIVQEVS